ncbi:MAG: hypothetical protein GX799_02755 [Crenarchaeota archaeon]|nr:hypothetical protein [Thermoproteota archaeon]
MSKNLFTTADGHSYPSMDRAGFCIFNDKTTKYCIVHQVKPETCCAELITFDINFQEDMLAFYLKRYSVCKYVGALF